MAESRADRGETVYEGKIVDVREETFRYADGETAEREIVVHRAPSPWSPTTTSHVWLVRQPREPVDEPDLLELPAGKLDVEGESPLEAMKRELVEEIGKEAEEWRELKRFYTSPGFAQEEVWIYLATGLRDVEHEPDPRRADRDRPVAAGGARRGDRGMHGLEDPDRPAPVRASPSPRSHRRRPAGALG